MQSAPPAHPRPKALTALLRGDGLRARALRGTAITFFGFGTQQVLRLLSNLVLTRLLFPEAFGLMALVTVVLTGLQLFSDIGIHTAIVQSRRGDDPAFLDTAWTLRILRGALLGLVTLALAGPMARFYDQPHLAELLMLAALNPAIQGFLSPKQSVAGRHLSLGRLTLLEIGCQLAGILVMIALAWLGAMVWSLVGGTLVTSLLQVILSHVALPGRKSRIGWEPTAARELFHFGKYVFIGSAAGFLLSDSDRAVLGKFVAVGTLGIYNIGFFPASVPMMLTRQFGHRILLPVYSRSPPGESAINRRNIRMARGLLTFTLIALGLFLALIGEQFIHLLYEEEYTLAGPIMVLVSLGFLPAIPVYAYGILLLSAGNSRDYTTLVLLQAGVQLGLLFVLVLRFGLIGAIVTPGLAVLVLYPVTAWFAHRNRGWDPLLDAAFALVIAAGIAAVLAVHDTAIAAVIAGPQP